MERIELETGATLNIAWAPNSEEGTRPTVLIVHGWKSIPLSSSSYELVRKALAELDMHTATLCLRGHEGTEGDIDTVTRGAHLQDVQHGMKWVANHPRVTRDRIGALGVSYGGYLLTSAMYWPSQDVFKAIALRAPALYPDEGFNDEPTIRFTDNAAVKAWRKRLRHPEDCRALAGLNTFRGDLMIVASEFDESIPVEVIYSYQKAARLCRTSQAIVLPGATHTLTEPARSEFVQHLSGWFEKKL